MQADIEKAILDKKEVAVLLLDYSKFFDMFEPTWCKNLLKKVGICGGRPELVEELYKNLKRYTKIGNTYGEAMCGSNGVGQGDVNAVLIALIFIDAQFRMLDSEFPDIDKSACLDDRSLRGQIASLHAAFRRIQTFDEKAGHETNPSKIAVSGTDKKTNEKIKKLNWGTDMQPVRKTPFGANKLTGHTITAQRRPMRKYQKERMEYALNTAKRCVHLPTYDALRSRVVAGMVIPRMLQDAQWCFPATRSLKRLRSTILSALWRGTRSLRCPEIVIAVLNDPTRVDPWGAAINQMFLKARRTLSRCARRREIFANTMRQILHDDAKHADKDTIKDRGIQGPAHAIFRVLKVLGLKGEIGDDDEGLTISDASDTAINLMNTPLPIIKRQLKSWIRRAIMATLRDDCQGDEPRRKDMIEVPVDVDIHATTANFSTARGKMPYKKDPLLRRELQSVITGAVRTADRLCAAGMIESDVCQNPKCGGARRTAKHIFCSCHDYSKHHEELEAVNHKVLDQTRGLGSQKLYEQVREILSNQTFLVTGICPDHNDTTELQRKIRNDAQDPIFESIPLQEELITMEFSRLKSTASGTCKSTRMARRSFQKTKTSRYRAGDFSSRQMPRPTKANPSLPPSMTTTLPSCGRSRGALRWLWLQ